MTFKHTKFDESPIMRSLERVAKEKGLVKSESIQKNASVKNIDVKPIDITPSDNLSDNILKLCNGLRSQGFNKYAEELESNFINYKKAQTIYEAHKETGEDLVNSAHPKGSHKLENVDSDEAVIENILDVHLKMTKMIDKKPTGKLSTSSAIQKIKTSLGQAPTLNPNQIKSIFNNHIIGKLEAAHNRARECIPVLQNAQKSDCLDEGDYIDVVGNDGLTKATKALQVMRSGLSTQYSFSRWNLIPLTSVGPLATLFPGQTTSPGKEKTGPTVQGVNEMIIGYDYAIKQCNDIDSKCEALKLQAQTPLQEAKGLCAALIPTITAYYNNTNRLPEGISVPASLTESSLKDTYKSKLNNLKARLNLYLSSGAENRILNPDNKKKIINFINELKLNIDNVIGQIDANSEEQLKSIKEDFDSHINNLTAKLTWYKTNVIDQIPVGK